CPVHAFVPPAMPSAPSTLNPDVVPLAATLSFDPAPMASVLWRRDAATGLAALPTVVFPAPLIAPIVTLPLRFAFESFTSEPLNIPPVELNVPLFVIVPFTVPPLRSNTVLTLAGPFQTPPVLIVA